MTLEDFDYDLPEELIAQTPLKDRSSSKLLVLNKDTGEDADTANSKILKPQASKCSLILPYLKYKEIYPTVLEKVNKDFPQK